MAREERIGNTRRNLVLETANSVRVLRGDKYYTLNFEESEATDSEGNSIESSFIVTDSIVNYQNGTIEYPGDNKIIFAKYSGVFYTENNSYIPMTLSNTTDVVSDVDENVFDETITLNGLPPFRINDSHLINNLNAEYLDGHTWDEFVLKEDYSGSSSGSNSSNTESEDQEQVIPRNNYVTIGSEISLEVSEEFLDAKTGVLSGVNIIQIIYELYTNNKIITTDSFVDLIKKILSPINHNWNFTAPNEDLLTEIIESENLFYSIKDIDLCKSIKLTIGGSLYDKLSSHIYFGDVSEYNGSTYILSSDDPSSVVPGMKLTGIVEYIDESSEDEDEPENDEEEGDDEEEVVTTDMIVVGISDEDIYVKTKIKTYDYLNSKASTEELEFGGDEEEGAPTIKINATTYSSESDEEESNVGWELSEIPQTNGIVGFVGNYTGETVENPWIKLNQNGGFIGLTKHKTPFLTIAQDGTAKLNNGPILSWTSDIYNQKPEKVLATDYILNKDELNNWLVTDDTTQLWSIQIADDENTSLSVNVTAIDQDIENVNMPFGGIRKESTSNGISKYTLWVNPRQRPYSVTLYLNKF